MGRAFEYRKATKLKRWGHMAKTFTRLGKQIAIKNGTAALSGIAQDLSPRGTLLVQTNSGLQEILIGDLQV